MGLVAELPALDLYFTSGMDVIHNFMHRLWITVYRGFRDGIPRTVVIATIFHVLSAIHHYKWAKGYGAADSDLPIISL